MAWKGFFVYGGSEIINAERTEAYIADANQPWFRPLFKSTAVSTLEDETYENPWIDPAPWGDPDNPDTYRFWGAYPLSITGLEDDTRTATITENVGDGGWIGPVRKGTKTAVFEVMLSGVDECATEAGFQWLKSALSGDPCSDQGCSGTELCYYACEPCAPLNCTPEERAACSQQNLRTLRNVKVIGGPTITAQRTATNGAAIWVVQFTLVAAVPFEFGVETPLVEGFMVASNPWVPDVVPADWDFSTIATTEVDDDCAVPVYQPLTDPLCPAVLVPPGPPTVPLGCFTEPDAWKRRWFTIPRKYIPYWGEVVPVVKVQASADVRGLRLRFYSDVDADASVRDDPCAYCGDILFSYIPANHTLVLDGVTQSVYAEGPGGSLLRADSLVFKTDGTPFDWPVLSCGFGYVVTVDLPSTHVGALPAVDLSLTGRSA